MDSVNDIRHKTEALTQELTRIGWRVSLFHGASDIRIKLYKPSGSEWVEVSGANFDEAAAKALKYVADQQESARLTTRAKRAM
jgi:pyridoxine 5'-phosphate synthase PdxJ